MNKAFLADMAQRVLTLNKWEQRVSLGRVLRRMPRGTDPRVLDFGCGTGLFAPTIARAGYRCTGLDIDPDLTAYAARLHPQARFVNSLDQLAGQRFDVILANCCFHHISAEDLATILERFREHMAPGGRVVVIDLVDAGRRSRLHDLFMKLEKGLHVRPEAALMEVVARHFEILRVTREYSGVFSLPWRANPFGNEKVILECR